MDKHVYLQMCLSFERLMADVALEWSFNRMDSHMRLQIARQSETFAADFTLMRFLMRMDKHVLFQTTLSGERLIADVTCEHRCCCSVDPLNRLSLYTTLCTSSR